MTATRKYWSCPCGTRNEHPKRKCVGCGKLKRKKRVPKHAEALRDNSYLDYAALNAHIHHAGHGPEWDLYDCGLCGKKPKARRHDRDHDHHTGNPRGLACWHCNRELLRHATLEELRAAVAYLERVEAFYGS